MAPRPSYCQDLERRQYGRDRRFINNENDNRVYNYPYRSQYDILQILLKREADVNPQSGFYSNALQTASTGGYFDIVQALLKAGADINAQSGKYSTALYAATEKGYQKIMEMLLSNSTQVGSRDSTIHG